MENFSIFKYEDPEFQDYGKQGKQAQLHDWVVMHVHSYFVMAFVTSEKQIQMHFKVGVCLHLLLKCMIHFLMTLLANAAFKQISCLFTVQY